MTDKDSSAADVECTAPYDQPQALTTTNMFQANHEDAYDSDVDEGPNAAVAFMANLSSTSANQQLVIRNCPRTAYWLPANEIASQASNPDRPVTPCIHTRPPPSQVLANLQKKKISALLCLLPDIVVPPIRIALRRTLDLHGAIGIHTKVLELEAEGKMTLQEYRCSDQHHEGVECSSTEGSCDQQALETDRIQLKDTITSIRIQLDGLKVENVSLQRRYDELSKNRITHSRNWYT
ncbi:hypothetical protein Tco_0726056 [Tanacetum coccineum]|uniref:Uncharacterized protein n=1 Tax=Tanacetum coccineum TaxID=301880 RepID=A0ABQ4YFG4_9ASTR